jgi:cell division protein FtsB
MRTQLHPTIGTLALMALALMLGLYFTFAAVQGDHGLFRRVQISAEIDQLRAERDALKRELVQLQNLTERLSDRWLDLDLLDERARAVLGVMRADEVVLH